MQFAVMEIGYVYFYTATILNWKNLLEPDKYKEIIIDSLKHLVDKKKIKVYGFVIMPNHVHFIWEMLAKNGKEPTGASLLTCTKPSLAVSDCKMRQMKIYMKLQVRFYS